MPVQHAGLRMAEVQTFARTRDGHIHQPTLLFQAVEVVHRIFVWEQGFFKACDKHRIKLQAFAGMNRHELNGVFTGLGLVVARFQCCVGKEGRQWRHHFAIFCVGCHF